MSIEVKNLRLKKFLTPNYVAVEWRPGKGKYGPVELPALHLSRIDAESLSQLCDMFRADVFEKAGVPDPRETTK